MIGLLLVFCLSAALPSLAIEIEQCELIKVPFCSGMQYNYTRMPNKFNHQKQEEAELEVIQFRPLVDIECSPDIRFFLCGLYTPICLQNFPKSVPVCRSVCERVKRSCFPIMKQYGFDWPPKMECSALPEAGTELCMDPSDVRRERFSPTPIKKTKTTSKSCSCPATLQFGKEGFYGKIEGCHSPCRNFYGETSLAYILEMVLSTLSIVCLIASCLTSFTFVVDFQRFGYPVRPIMYISYCYIMVSLGFVIRLSVGHENTSCAWGPSESLYSVYGIRYDKDYTTCLGVFLLTYYFGMAACVWWISLTICWFLSSKLKWAPEAISGISWSFHLVSWTLPGIKTALILFFNIVDGDPVSGICYVGSQNRNNLMGFVIFPLMIYIMISFAFLMKAIISLFQIHRSLPKNQVQSFEKLLKRIVAFSVLFISPTIIVWSCWVYELYVAAHWEESVICLTPPRVQPNLKVFFLKYTMMLIPGISTMSWICSEKTIEISWQKFTIFPNGFKKRITPPVPSQV